MFKPRNEVLGVAAAAATGMAVVATVELIAEKIIDKVVFSSPMLKGPSRLVKDVIELAALKKAAKESCPE